MEVREETRKFKLIIFVIILAVVATVKSCSELRYTLSGKTAEGTLTGAQETRTSRRTSGVILTYRFSDAAGKTHKGRATVSHARAAELAGQKPEVTYLPSSPETSTLTSERSPFWPVVLGIMLVVLAVTVYQLHREAHGLDRRR
jgi:hypothetical protein